jgi:hypothetical protein
VLSVKPGPLMERDDTPRALHSATAIVRATLHATWGASKVGAIYFATLFTIVNLGVTVSLPRFAGRGSSVAAAPTASPLAFPQGPSFVSA